MATKAGSGETEGRPRLRNGESADAGLGAEPEEKLQGTGLRSADLGAEVAPKRVVFTMAGKGGVGKTTLMVALAEWYADKGLKAQLLDMDPDNKAEGSFYSFFPGATRMNMADDNAYDTLAGHSLESDHDILLADMGGSQGYRLIPWFLDFYASIQAEGIPMRWTAVGVVTPDIASARTVLEWAEQLGGSVDYVIVHNYFRHDKPYQSSFDEPLLQEAVQHFRTEYRPIEIRMDNRRSDMQELMRKHCVTLGGVMSRMPVRGLDSADVAFRARTYRFRLFQEFDKAGMVLLP